MSITCLGEEIEEPSVGVMNLKDGRLEIPFSMELIGRKTAEGPIEGGGTVKRRIWSFVAQDNGQVIGKFVNGPT